METIKHWTFDESLLLGKIIPNCAVEHKITMEYTWTYEKQVKTNTSRILFVMPKTPTYTWCKVIGFKHVEEGYYSNFGYLQGIELVLEDTKQPIESIDYNDNVFEFKSYSKQELVILKQLRKLFNTTQDYTISMTDNKLSVGNGLSKGCIYKLIDFYQSNQFDEIRFMLGNSWNNSIRFYGDNVDLKLNKKWVTLKINSRRFILYCAFIKGKITTSQYLKELNNDTR